MRRCVFLVLALTACGRIGFDPNAPLSSDGATDDATGDGAAGAGWIGPTSLVGVPVGRYWHTGVWTGNEMIVFGGTTADATNHVNTGGRYDPANDTWTATTTTGAPSTRSWHSALWTGSRMLIWGGRGPNNTGGQYNPVTDSWSATSTTGAPSARYVHTAVWTGTKMIVWGGYATGAVYLNTGGQYDPLANTWSPTTTVGAPSQRDSHVGVWTGTRMLVWGGCISPSGTCPGGTYLNDGGSYDPEADAWTPITTTSAPAGRSSFRGFWLGGSFGRFLVWGGQLSDGSDTNTGGLYDPATDTWKPTSVVGAPAARRAFSAVWTGSRMIVWGGYGSSAGNTGGIYDPATDTWTAMPATGAPPGRGEPLGPSAVWTGSEMIVWGGDGPNSGENTGGRFAP